MRFLADERLYADTERCLRYLRGLENVSGGSQPRIPKRHHFYWYGPFSRKQGFALKSFLATQDPARVEPWLWLDAADGYDGHEENAFLRPLLPFVRVKRFDPVVEGRGTPVEGRPELYEVRPSKRSDFFRQVVLHTHGGIYADMDVMLLRDLGRVIDDPRFSADFCYRWSAHMPFGNSAVLGLTQGGETAHTLLLRCRERGDCSPVSILRFEESGDLDMLVLPCVFFDPLWPAHDGKDKHRAVPFRRFEDFFRPFSSLRSPRKHMIRSDRKFFPGALAYHWHNCWNEPEHDDSWFGYFEKKFDRALKLGD